MRINKYIANSGVCSRRKADELIQDGKVTLNGEIIENLGLDVDELKDEICVFGRKIKLEEKKIYIMLNKPKGYITTNDEQFSRPSTTELINEDLRVFPVGRLDMNTEGLLLFTNDGEFANKLMHPKNKIKKIYIVNTNSEITNEKIEKLKNGVDIGEYITMPATVNKISKSELEITISEGKNRQVRRMCDAVEIKVISLKRVQIGNLKLDDLKLGEYKILTDEEVNKVFE